MELNLQYRCCEIRFGYSNALLLVSEKVVEATDHTKFLMNVDLGLE